MRLHLLALGLLISGLVQAAVDVNRATEADLDGIKGLGPATTRLILAEREKTAFRNWADLLARVKGLGPASATRLSAEGLTVNGEPYTPGKPNSKAP